MFLSFQSNNCSLAKLSPSELVRHHEEAEVCIKSQNICINMTVLCAVEACYLIA